MYVRCVLCDLTFSHWIYIELTGKYCLFCWKRAVNRQVVKENCNKNHLHRTQNVHNQILMWIKICFNLDALMLLLQSIGMILSFLRANCVVAILQSHLDNQSVSASMCGRRKWIERKLKRQTNAKVFNYWHRIQQLSCKVDSKQVFISKAVGDGPWNQFLQNDLLWNSIHRPIYMLQKMQQY